MPDHAQFGVRKNQAPHSRQRGLRFAADTNSKNVPVSDALQSEETLVMNSPSKEFQSPLQAAPIYAATAGETHIQTRLLTVHEVAELLQVPVSWVYGRTRRRSAERLPGYLLGKYWRFDTAQVLEWVARHRSSREAA
jgi:excisionase family DNA binding protein